MEPVSIALVTVGWLMSTLVSKAVTKLFEEWAKRVGLGKEFKALTKELKKINTTLGSARGFQTHNNDLLDLLKDMQQLAYKADDLLDELDYYWIQDKINIDAANSSSSQITDSTGSSSSSFSGLTTRALLSAVNQVSHSSIQDVFGQVSSSIPNIITMAGRMNELVDQLRETGEDFYNALMLDATVAKSRANTDNPDTITNPRETTSRMIEKAYGRDQEQKDLINLLIGDGAANRTLSVIAIVGQGGIGKTTLAQLVYDDQGVKTHFDLQMWVTVSVNFDVHRFTQKILESASRSNPEKLINLDNLQTELEKSLETKRFLLVLDDLWEDKKSTQWKSLLAPLRNISTKGNAVLVTTRKPGVEKLDRTIKSISLVSLKENKFWSLFKYWSFGDEMHEGHPDLQRIGREIVKKLKGNPLAARTVGTLLNKNLDASHWRGVLKREQWKARDGEDDIMPALRISYEYLPFHLQRCFSYCALFPKDYKFRQVELVNIWMAQGFLYVQGKRMEEVGKEYLDDLFGSGFFQECDPGFSFRIFVIHDLLHDLAQNVSLEECLSVDGGETQAILPAIHHLSVLTETLYESDETEHGISVNNRFEKELIKVEKHVEPGMLSTIMFFDDHDSINPKSLERFQSKFKDSNRLRVLRLGTIPNVQLLLSSVHNFTHLRYLELRSDYSCKTLPGEICRLYHLQVLNVSQWENLKELPSNFNNLINLRHFIPFHNRLYSLIASVGKLAQLQELCEFTVRKEREFAIEQLRELKELRGELSIYHLENVKFTEEAKGVGLIEEASLNSLKLSWNQSENSDVGHAIDADVLEGLQPHHDLNELKITGYGGATSPTWLTNLHLEVVSLVKCIAWEILPPLGRLLFLKRLKLKSMPTIREIGPSLYGCGQHMAFQCLEVMILEDMPELAKWVWNDHCQNLPALSELSIVKCPELDLSLSNCASEAEFNKRFPHLVKLQISECPKVLWLTSLPWNSKIATIRIDNVRSFENFSFSDSELFIKNPNNPGAWDDIRFHNLVTITSLHIASNRYPLSWENLCYLTCLKKLQFNNSPVLFSFPNEGPNDKKCLQLTSLKSLTLWSCGITGKQLSWILQHLPVLSELIIGGCREIKSIAVETKMNEPNSITSSLVELGEDEGFLQIPSSLTSLEKLDIQDCPDMVIVSKGGLSGLVSIQELQIKNCSKLLASMVCDHSISKANLLPPKLLKLTMINVPEGTSQLLEGLSSLTYLIVDNSRELKSFDLTSCFALEKLILWDCQKLASLKGLESLAHLKNLNVENCAGFADAWISASYIGFSMPLESLVIDSTAVLVIPICKQLTSLQDLTFRGKAVDLTEEQVKSLLLLTSLKVIQFRYCTNLRHLPTNLHLLTSVKKLIIFGGENIQSLPANGLPKSLKKIEVWFSGDKVKKMFEEYERQLKKEDGRRLVLHVGPVD